jgi:hypothetical protein
MSLKSLHIQIDMLQMRSHCLTANSYGLSGYTGHVCLNGIFYKREEPPDHFRKAIDQDGIDCPQIFRPYSWEDD